MISMSTRQNRIPNPIQLSFSNAKLTYDEHSPVQQRAGKELIKLIDENFFNKIIDIGCGTGLITKELYQYRISNSFEALDFSEEFLTIAKSRNVKNNIIYQYADFDSYFAQQQSIYDLIFANMSLQWSKNFSLLLKQLYNSMNIDGSLAFTIPINGTFKELDNYHINKFLALNNVISLLNQTGFSVKSAYEKAYTINFNTPVERLRSIKKTGASHFQGTRQSIDKSIFKQLRQSCQSNRQSCPLTYNIGLFYAKK
jgi:malonyl-CoA O-methyltransferase